MIFRLAVGLTTPLAIDDELEFVPPRVQRHNAMPMAVALTHKWDRLGIPVVETAGEKHGLGVWRMDGKVRGF